MPLAKTPNTSICREISFDDIMCYNKRESGFDGPSLKEFLSEFVSIIEEKNIQNACLIFDNYPVHRNVDIKEVPLFLLPYSPNLNPIENILGAINQYIKQLRLNNNEWQSSWKLQSSLGKENQSTSRYFGLQFCYISIQIILKESYDHMKKCIDDAHEGKYI